MKSLIKDWKSSSAKLHSIKYLAIMSFTIAMKIIVSSFFFTISENLRIYFSFIVVAVEAVLIGPAAGLISGAITDILSFILHPSGPFFPGYILTAMLSSFLYAIFLYQKKIKLWRIIAAKFCVNFFINVLMGSLWSSIMFSKGYIFYATKSLIKNTILLPIEVFVLLIVFKLLIPILEKRNLITKQ